ncbi:MAG: aminoglycoside 6-adenylyltransferase [Chloroflexi bacterium]|nr:aminoglycoside 6-adenylyltransferase [Chloroflexota bacterium]MBU1746728.1 aminoglycoside 6-adenylyltransferase [Chloroflexota bacterium]MBU1879617.1 aminoglycoside 6-adenylyltransferase [Chloroflexota bacterium]
MSEVQFSADEIARAYERLIERFVTWAQEQDDIRAAVVIGSRARTDHPADEWADLDVLVGITDPQRFLATPDWVAHVAPYWLTFTEPTGTGEGMERRVLFEGGLDVDFALVPADVVGQMVEAGPHPDVADIVRRGVRIVLDKDDLLVQLVAGAPEPPLPQPPTQAEFLNVVSDFWYHAPWTAKHLRRGELWWAKGCCDAYMKGLLRQMLEWHARATHGRDHDTWMRGRFLEEWADPRAVAALSAAFAHYDEADVWRALFVTMDLFHWVAAETAERLGYPYPAEAKAHATELVRLLYETDSQRPE